jgi:hypothetical protein
MYLLILTVIVLAAIGSYFSFLRDDQRRIGLTSEVEANVTNTEVRRRVDPESGKEVSVDIIVNFDYEIDGRKYQRTVRKSKTKAVPFTPWGKAKVCYDPSNLKTIEEAELFPVSFRCGGM